MNYEEVLDIILEYHYETVKFMIKDCREMKRFIKLQDQAEAAKLIYWRIVNSLPEAEKKRYTRLSKEKFNTFAELLFFTKTKKTEEE